MLKAAQGNGLSFCFGITKNDISINDYEGTWYPCQAEIAPPGRKSRWRAPSRQRQTRPRAPALLVASDIGDGGRYAVAEDQFLLLGHRNRNYAGFDWQTGYGACSVSHSLAPAVTRYIGDQEKHHRRVTFQEEFLTFLTKNGVAYDERYIGS
jgi:hypothetical protein